MADEGRGTVEDDFEAFFRAQHPRLVAIALALTGDVETARDAAQECLLRAYPDWARLRALELPSAWLRRVLVNLAIDARRRQSRDVRLAERLGGSSMTFDPADALSGAGAEESVTWQAVRELPERQRAAVVLRYVDDLPVTRSQRSSTSPTAR